MGVYELKPTQETDKESGATESVAAVSTGRSWGMTLLWIVVAVVVAGALAGGGWLAFQAGRQASGTGRAATVNATGAGARAAAFGQAGATGFTGAGSGRGRRAAAGATGVTTDTVAQAQPQLGAGGVFTGTARQHRAPVGAPGDAANAANAAPPMGATGVTTDTAGQARPFIAETGVATDTTAQAFPARGARPEAAQASAGAVAAAPAAEAGGLGAITATTQPAPVTINTQPRALEQAGQGSAATSSLPATAFIPAIVVTPASPMLDDAGAAVATLATGDDLRATARSTDGQWLAVQNDTASGWMARTAVIAYGVGDLAAANPPDAVRAAAQQSAAPTASAASASTLVTTGPTATGATAAPAASDAAAAPAAAAPDAAAAAAPAAAPAIIQTSGVQAQVETALANLNVRAGPGTAYAIVAKVATGATVTPTARDSAADWLKITLATGESGWAAATYLRITGDPLTLPVEAAPALPPQTAPAAATIGATTSSSTAAAAPAAADSLSGTLAFQQSPGGMMWTYNLANGALQSLVNGFDPAISPDGSTVAFVREGGEAGIYLINSDGSNQRLIYNERGRLSAPKWSDDGQWILFGRGDEGYVCYPMGNACLTEDELKARSPHGTPLSLPSEYRYFDKLSVVDHNGKNFHDIPSLTSAKAADWANGNIVYQSSAGLRRTADGNSAAYQLILFLPLEQQFQDPDWQPGGNEIVFQQKGTTQRDLWAINADGTNLHGLTKAVTTLVKEMPSNVSPAFSPDGKHIVYLSNRTDSEEAGDWRLWVMDADGSNQHPLSINVPITYTFGAEQVVSWGG